MSVLKIRKLALENSLYRKPLYVKDVEVTLYALTSAEDIPEELHQDVTQVIYVVEGSITVRINGKDKAVNTDEVVVIPPNTYHKISPRSLVDGYTRFYSIYSKPQHLISEIKIKQDADDDD